MIRTNHRTVEGQHRSQYRQDQCHRYEAHIANCESCRLTDIFGLEVASVYAFAKNDTGVVAQLPVELAVTDIDGVHARGTALEQAIGKSAGR